MNNVNENKKIDVKLIKHFIKDLSFENPQSINELNANYNNNNNIEDSMNVFHENYENRHFSLVLKYYLVCTSKKNHKKLCHLELEYFGFFKILNEKEVDQKTLAENALNLLFPFVKEIIMNISQWGGSVPITLNNVDLSLIKN
tara:strand:- start:11 stop:439 length:429 start_codon:yes stop_codon:yes gene_type:complete